MTMARVMAATLNAVFPRCKSAQIMPFMLPSLLVVAMRSRSIYELLKGAQKAGSAGELDMRSGDVVRYITRAAIGGCPSPRARGAAPPGPRQEELPLEENSHEVFPHSAVPSADVALHHGLRGVRSAEIRGAEILRPAESAGWFLGRPSDTRPAGTRHPGQDRPRFAALDVHGERADA